MITLRQKYLYYILLSFHFCFFEDLTKSLGAWVWVACLKYSWKGVVGSGVGDGDLVACAAWLLWVGGCFAGCIELLWGLTELFFMNWSEKLNRFQRFSFRLLKLGIITNRLGKDVQLIDYVVFKFRFCNFTFHKL